MDAAELLHTSSTLLEVHRNALIIDPFVKISIDLCDGDFVSECKKDNAALSWRIKLNPNRHNDIIDVQYSIVEALLLIMFDDFSLIDNSNAISEYQKRLVSRLTAAICQMMDLSDDEPDQELSDEG